MARGWRRWRFACAAVAPTAVRDCGGSRSLHPAASSNEWNRVHDFCCGPQAPTLFSGTVHRENRVEACARECMFFQRDCLYIALLDTYCEAYADTVECPSDPNVPCVAGTHEITLEVEVYRRREIFEQASGDVWDLVEGACCGPEVPTLFQGTVIREKRLEACARECMFFPEGCLFVALVDTYCTAYAVPCPQPEGGCLESLGDETTGLLEVYRRRSAFDPAVPNVGLAGSTLWSPLTGCCASGGELLWESTLDDVWQPPINARTWKFAWQTCAERCMEHGTSCQYFELSTSGVYGETPTCTAHSAGCPDPSRQACGYRAIAGAWRRAWGGAGSWSWPPCPWQSPSPRDAMYQCFDGTFCNWTADDALTGSNCCNPRGNVARCPADTPAMCNPASCPGTASDCCGSEAWCALRGGERNCTGFGCLAVDISIAADAEEMFYRTSGRWVPLPASCGCTPWQADCPGHCTIHICDEGRLHLVDTRGFSHPPAAFVAAVGGVEVTTDVPLHPGSNATFELDVARSRWVPVEEGCCGGTAYPEPLFRYIMSGPESFETKWQLCTDKCTDLLGVCSYVRLGSVVEGAESTSVICAAYTGACGHVVNETCPAWQVGGSWKRISQKALEEIHADGGPGGCRSESAWRRQSWVNFSGTFERCGTQKVCVSGHPECTSQCTADDQCENFPQRVCRDGSCRHRRLFAGPAGTDVGAAIVFFLISGMALAAGIGGGGLYVPLLMVLLRFSTHEATGLSQALLAGGSSSAFVYNIRQRHPTGKGPMIDYDLALVMGPHLLLGAVLGGALNVAAPSWLIMLLLTGILGNSAFKTLRKAFEELKKEQEAQVTGSYSDRSRLSKNPIDKCLRSVFGWSYEEMDERRIGNIPRRPPSQVVGNPMGTPPQFGTGEGDEADPGSIELENASNGTGSKHDDVASNGTEDAAGRPQYPRDRLLLFFAVWAFCLVMIFARGGRAAPGLAPFCSVGYWVLGIWVVTGLGVLGFIGAWQAVKSPQGGDADDDFQWSTASARRIALWSVGAGVLASLCGIGGGMIMGPVLLDLGVRPQVQSATTATTLFVLSTSTAIFFIVQGTVPIPYAVFMAFSTALGAVFGKAVIGWVVKRYRRPSAIIFLLGGVILASVVVMAITGVVDIANDIRNGSDMMFKGLCAVEMAD